MKNKKYFILFFLVLSSVTFASVRKIGYSLESAVMVPVGFSKEIDSKLPKSFKNLSFNVLMTCTKKGHPKHLGDANIRCVALDVLPIEN